jgi:hypothetical protein
MSSLNILDTVTNLRAIPLTSLLLAEPERFSKIDHLPPGQVGTVLETNSKADGIYYLIEFADLAGREYAMANLKAEDLLALHYDLTAA